MAMSVDPKAIISRDRPKAKKSYWCINCGHGIAKGEKHVKVVWKGKERKFHSDRMHIVCPKQEGDHD
jgi:hypothetical protein